VQLNNLDDIVESGLCAGCGLCESLAGRDAVAMDMTIDGRMRPRTRASLDPLILEKIMQVCPGVTVTGYEGLTVDFARKHDLRAILRGLRAVSDFEYEFQLATMNRHLTDEVETVFLTPTENYTFVSSSLVREVAEFGGDVSTFVHPEVVTQLKAKFGN